MQDLDEIINGATDVWEVKRAMSVKMERSGITPAQIYQLLHVSPQYVSKWKGQYETEGAAALRLGHRGSESYLSGEQREEVVQGVEAHETLSVEAVRDHIEERYGIL
jgi:transposase